jgi:hypothetical protein
VSLPEEAPAKRKSRIRDPRVWFGIAITVFFIWLVARDVNLGDVKTAIARADWVLLLGLSIPLHLLNVYVRALRWRHLTNPIVPIPRATLFRAVAVGFMANNIFPLRMGEVIRSLYLSREVGVRGSAVFGTVILERVIDTMMVIGLAASALVIQGAGSDSHLARGAIFLIPVALAPMVGLVCLRLWPDKVVATAAWMLKPFPEKIENFITKALGRFSEGLGALTGGIHLFWIAFHSLVIWLVLSPVPILAGFWALDIDMGSTMETLIASWITLAAVGIAVAIPSAPGFFGTYHAACTYVLEPFGVSSEVALALGTLVHGVFWVTLTLLGFAVLRSRNTSLGELDKTSESGKESP